MAQLVECQTRTGVCAVESLKGSSVLHYSALDVYMYAFTFALFLRMHTCTCTCTCRGSQQMAPEM